MQAFQHPRNLDLYEKQVDSVAYKFGYEHGLKGDEYRCPITGNPQGEANYDYGWRDGRAAANVEG